MRIVGMIKIFAAILVGFFAAYEPLGLEAAIILTAGIVLYGWLGEYVSLFSDRAISVKNLNSCDRIRLERIKDLLTNDAEQIGANISGLKLHVVPSDDINAFAYGFSHVGITQAAMNACDDMTLCAVLSHELSHILNLDAVFHRVIAAEVMLVIGALAMGSFAGVAAIWIIFAGICLFGLGCGFLPYMAARGIGKLVKGIFSGLQWIVLFLYRVLMGVVGRGCEFKADRYSCQLGYGAQLSYFLDRFVAGEDRRHKTLNEILYASHPSAYKRIQRIEQYCASQTQELALRR